MISVPNQIFGTIIEFGTGAITRINYLLYSLKAKKILIVAGSSAISSGLVDRIRCLCPSVEFEIHSGVQPNPSIEAVKSCIESILRFCPDAILAVGGGSVIDVSKISSVFGYSDDEIISCAQCGIFPTSRVPLISIPTISGTGSEITPFAVLYADDKKYSLDNEVFRSFACIIDPELQINAPIKSSLAAAFDAFCQSIEAYFACRSNNESDLFANEAITILPDAIRSLANDPINIACRERLAYGSLMSGAAISLTRTTAAHALSYPLTINYGIAHGFAVSMFLPEVFLYNSEVQTNDCADTRGVEHVRSKIEKINEIIGTKTASESANFMQSLFQSFHAVELPKIIDIEKLQNSVNPERLQNNPRKMNPTIIKEIYLRVLNV